MITNDPPPLELSGHQNFFVLNKLKTDFDKKIPKLFLRNQKLGKVKKFQVWVAWRFFWVKGKKRVLIVLIGNYDW